jgi:hypothetical protein
LDWYNESVPFFDLIYEGKSSEGINVCIPNDIITTRKHIGFVADNGTSIIAASPITGNIKLFTMIGDLE